MNRQTTQPLPVLAAQSSTGMFLGAVPQRHHARASGLRHFPPRQLRDLFPEACPRTWQTAILGLLAVAVALLWFVRTPSARPERQPIAAAARAP